MNDYQRWLDEAKDPVIHQELVEMTPEQIEAAFYKDLEFGTGGLRGILGAGSACLNIYTVGKISQGISNFLNRKEGKKTIAISYDSRINSTLFAKTAASVYAANGIHVYLYKELMPTPLLSYAVRYFKADAGVMVTASHNPKQYNGYKVYDEKGCQLTDDAANEISALIEALDIFKDVKSDDFDKLMNEGMIEYIKDDCLETYLQYIDTKRIPSIKNRDLSIVYTPLNGTGLVPVTKALKRFGFDSVAVVKEQEFPDGNFTTCPKPNPELKESLALGVKLLEEKHADILIATDPDCDRCGTAVIHNGETVLINGNEMGILLVDFLLRNKKIPEESIVVKTIVSTDLIFPIAKANGLKVVEVLTGFKYIGDQIARLENIGHPERYFFGFEESYGYLSGTEVRDKDAVDAVILIAQMAQDLKDQGKDPVDRLQEIYAKYGYAKTALDNFEFEGPSGVKIMQGI
ncbi:MAG: phospho-sugar mutase, partial [Bacilli bacterium]|nr:phospho-sugar mutase [Bacilli bacterium]